MDSQYGDSHEVVSDDRFRRQLLELLNSHAKSLTAMEARTALDCCLLDKITRILCMMANESHKQALQIKAIGEAINSLLEDVQERSS